VQRRVLVGGVGYWWQRDCSFGLVACEHLSKQEWPRTVQITQLDYGALYVAQDLADAQPPYSRLVLIASAVRDREPGRLYIREWRPQPLDPEDVQARIREAGAGVVDLDHLLVIAQHFRALPPEVTLLEIEPVDTSGGEGLSPQVEALLGDVVEHVRQRILGGVVA
jgi:hydrogenase maturation protease